MTKFLKILFILPLLFLSACKDENKNILTMATSADYAPFEFYQEQEIVGFDVELARIVTSNLGYELKIVDMDFAGIIPALQTGKVDFAMSAINPTPQRAENVDFSDVYYSNDASFLFLRDGFNDDLLNFQDKKFGVQSGSVFEEFLLDQQKSFPSIQIHSVAKIPLLLEELKLKRIDAIMLDNEIANTMLPNIPGAAILDVSGFNFGAAIAFPKGKQELVDAFNNEIKKLAENGQIEELKAKWFTSAAVSDMTVEEVTPSPVEQVVVPAKEEVEPVQVIEVPTAPETIVVVPTDEGATPSPAVEAPESINVEEAIKEVQTPQKDIAHEEPASTVKAANPIEERAEATATTEQK